MRWIVKSRYSPLAKGSRCEMMTGFGEIEGLKDGTLSIKNFDFEDLPDEGNQYANVLRAIADDLYKRAAIIDKGPPIYIWPKFAIGKRRQRGSKNYEIEA